MKNLSGNSVSQVWRDGDWIYKKQPKYMTDNEVYALTVMADTGYVPRFMKVDIETIKMEYIENEPVTDCREFKKHALLFINAIRDKRLRHGDLTKYAVLVRDNQPIVIDWAESRIFDDPRPDKRREGDSYWLLKTVEELCGTKDSQDSGK